MLEILKFLFAWADKHGAALIAGFIVGGAAVWIVIRRQKPPRCYYQDWIEAFRKDPHGWKK